MNKMPTWLGDRVASLIPKTTASAGECFYSYTCTNKVLWQCKYCYQPDISSCWTVGPCG
jgi:hypothetical protein